MDTIRSNTGTVRNLSLNSQVMTAGLVLIATGSVVGAIGLGVGCTAMVRSFRRWLTAQYEGPIAKQRVVSAKAAPATKEGALQKEMATPTTGR